MISPVWPLPAVTSGPSQLKPLTLQPNFQFVQTQATISPLVDRAIERYLHLIDPSPQNRGNKKSPTPSHKKTDDEANLSICDININYVDLSSDERLQLQPSVDNSYTLSVHPGKCSMTSNTIWGALYALETFSQYLYRDQDESSNAFVAFNGTDVEIQDQSRFGHRGVLIDASRHYLPLSQVKQVVDSIAMNKFNVLHWHISDAQSSPLVFPDTEGFLKGAYSLDAIYISDSISTIRDYAADRGVTVIFEVDVPGHTGSWRFGYPELMADCIQKYTNVNNYALNPSLPATYDLMSKVITNIAKVAKNTYMHLGGDEVVYGCWSNDASITAWMQTQGFTNYNQVLDYFVSRVDQLAYDAKLTPIHWEEVFFAGANLDTTTLVQVWTNSSNVALVTSGGYQVIASPSNYWYADILSTTWQMMYGYDPVVGLTAAQAALIVGGEVAIWGEHVDESNLQSVLFPRASAVAERLWSPATVTDQNAAHTRLLIQRCRMVQRGFQAAPVDPSFCNTQYV